MFGKLGQIAELVKNAGSIKQSMQDMQARMAAARYVGDAGAGQVTATVDGRGELLEVRISPDLVTAGDVEMIEDLVVAAVRQAATYAREATQKEMAQLTGGLNLPGMGDLLGGLPK
ncbi:MAG: YbaB/EbfC family nucleoid-associated protein [Planctomycetia bacterium]|nr:MAG: YbaB/EbfC family nucleoid-associated protein [Planctomycetia bacterium]